MSYGYKKLPVKKARTGEDVGMETGMSALSGAQTGYQMGSQFGPLGGAIGAGVGAVGMGVDSYIKGKDAQQHERGQASNTDLFNKGVDRLDTIGSGINNNLMRTQYKHGGEPKSGNAEVEGGELLLDKNHNVERIYKGASHKNGGIAETFDNSDDDKYIVPKKDASKVKALVRRYKLNGDTTAKKALDSYEEKLPEQNTDEVYAANGAQIKTDKNGNQYRFTNGGYQYKEGNNDWIDIKDEGGIASIEKLFDGGVKGGDLSGMPGAALNGENAFNLSQGEELKFKDYGFQPHNTGDITPTTKEDYSNKGLDSSGFNTNPFDFSNDIPNSAELGETSGFRTQGQPESLEASNPFSFTPNQDAGGSLPDVGTISDPGGKRNGVQDGVQEEAGSGFNTNKLQGALGAVGEASNFIYNLNKGNEDIAGVNRRFQDSEKYDYIDRSERDRQANLENRNAQRQNLRGKGLSAGQQTGYNRAAGRDYLRGQSAINQREAQRADQVNQFNTQLTNQDQRFNNKAADRYDTIERQQLAARDSFKGTAFSELAQFSNVKGREASRKEKNRKQNERDKFASRFIGTRDTELVGEGYNSKVKYK